MTSNHNLFRSVLFVLFLSIFHSFSFGQKVNIFELMQRRDLRLSEIDNIAKRHFNEVGRVRGTGHKQYERWKFEMQFHLDENGYLRPVSYDALQYQTASASLSTLASSGTWKEMGPTKWNRTSGWNPGVGRIESIAVHPLDTNLIYVTSPGGGLWKSTVGGGNSWTPLSDKNNAMMDVYAVAVDPNNLSIVLTGNGSGNIFKSIDAGTTWTTVSSGMSTVKKILYDPTNSNTIWAAASGGIYKSVNGGSTWTRIISTAVEDIEIQPGNTSVMYASGNNILRSADGGTTWVQLGTTEGITNSGRTLLGVSPNNALVVYAVQANGSEFGRLYKSTDGGATFITTVVGSSATGTNYFGYDTNGAGTGGQAWYDMGITVNPLDANDVYIAGIIVWRSTNGGTSFTANTAWSLPNSTGYNHADVHVLEWVNKTIYSGSDGGIYKKYYLATGGNSWVDLSSGLGIRLFYRIASPKTGKTVVTGGAQDNGTSIIKSGVWYDWLGADGMDCIFSPLDSNLVWGTSQYGSVYRSSNGGASYSGVSVPTSGNWITPLAIEGNSNVIYGGWNGVYKSTDLGNSWTKISGTTISSLLNTLAVAPSNPLYIYASVGSTLYVTKDGGTTWTTINTGSSINQVSIHPTNPEKIWIAYSTSSNNVVVSTDAGTTRTLISAGLPSIAARSIAIDPLDESLYVGMNIGVYFKAASSSSWVNITDNLPLVAINEIELHAASRMVRLGTYGRGLWEMPMINGCIAPTSASSSNVTYKSATLTWDGLGGNVGFTVEYKKSSDASWIVSSTTHSSNTISLSGLQENTSYDFRVSTSCEATPTLITTTFTTLPFVCPAATGLSSSNITASSATVSWTSLTDVLSYAIEYKLSTDLNWTIASAAATGTSYALSGLSSGLTYNWRVTPNCSSSTGTAASASFTTTFTCTTPTNISVSNITGTSATISWNTLQGATGYDLDYKVTTSTKWIKAATATTATSINLSSLTASTTYDYRIRTYCGTAMGYSGYTQAKFQTITPCSDAYEANNTSSTAKSISLNSELTAYINASGDVDWYKFVTPNTGGANIRITVYNLPANYDLQLYNSTGATLLSSSVQSGTNNETIVRNSAGNKTTYLIMIKGASGTDFNATLCYKFKVETSATAFPSVSPGVFSLSTSNESNQTNQVNLQNFNWKMYPVPAHHLLNISFNSPMDTKAECTLTDLQGRTVFNKSIHVMSGYNLQQLNLEQLHSGVYFIKLTGMDRPIVDKIIIQ